MIARSDLYFQDCGSGPTLILLHGNGENSDYFKEQIKVFGKHFHVFAIDTRGHGRSPRGDEPFTIEQFALDLKEFMASQRIQKAHILGFSDGGNIALTLTLKDPQLVDRLILNGANLSAGGVKRRYQIPIVLAYRFLRLFSRISLKIKRKAELFRLMVEEPKIEASALSNLHSPTLVLVGKSDMIKKSHSQLIANSLPKARLAVIKGDHFIAKKNPRDYNREVLNFLLEE